MALPNNPFRRRTGIEVPPVPPPDPKNEDLGEAVPLGEPEDDGYVIEEEDPELEPPPKQV